MKNLYRFNKFLLVTEKSIGDFAEDLMSSMDKIKAVAEEANSAIPLSCSNDGSS